MLRLRSAALASSPTLLPPRRPREPRFEVIRCLVIWTSSLFLAAAAAATATATVAATPSGPPGRFIDLGGWKLYLDCEGSGRPTAVIETGFEEYARDWVL